MLVMSVREMKAGEETAVREMMKALWPKAGEYDFSDERVFVWARSEGGLGGFVSVSIRPWAEGCDSEPCPYIEGWWVAPDLRRKGVGRLLFTAVEDWARGQGFVELGSDTEIENTASVTAHQALGFEPTERLQYFRKRLG